MMGPHVLYWILQYLQQVFVASMIYQLLEYSFPFSYATLLYLNTIVSIGFTSEVAERNPIIWMSSKSAWESG